MNEYIVSNLTEELKISLECNDLPIENPDQDHFGYYEFAKLIVDFILNLRDPVGTVLALKGDWGTGKSSIINLICYEFEKLNLSDSKKSFIIKLDPWWFSENTDLTQRFLLEIAFGLGSKDYNEIKKCFAKLCESISLTLKNVPFGEGVFKGAADYFNYNRPLYDQLLFLSSKLKSIKERIVIVIDNIDRLDVNECRTIFKTIKTLGNLPNIIYILALDESVICKLLEKDEIYGCKGTDYLDKIIQVPINIPKHNIESLKNFFIKKIFNIFNSEMIFSDYEYKYLISIFYDYLSDELDNPRKITKFIKYVSLLYINDRNNINYFDLVVIEYIKQYHPKLYSLIYNSKYYLVYHNNYLDESSLSNINKFITENNIYGSDSDLISILFPKLKEEKQILNIIYEKKKISSKYYFEKYFKHENLINRDVLNHYYKLIEIDTVDGMIDYIGILEDNINEVRLISDIFYVLYLKRLNSKIDPKKLVTFLFLISDNIENKSIHTENTITSKILLHSFNTIVDLFESKMNSSEKMLIIDQCFNKMRTNDLKILFIDNLLYGRNKTHLYKINKNYIFRLQDYKHIKFTLIKHLEFNLLNFREDYNIDRFSKLLKTFYKLCGKNKLYSQIVFDKNYLLNLFKFLFNKDIERNILNSTNLYKLLLKFKDLFSHAGSLSDKKPIIVFIITNLGLTPEIISQVLTMIDKTFDFYE